MSETLPASYTTAETVTRIIPADLAHLANTRSGTERERRTSRRREGRGGDVYRGRLQ
jgi:hypothetical protein